MCEPNHSIVQFPHQDDDDNPTGPTLDTIQTDNDPLWEKLKKRVGNWFHFSKLGFGHSESLHLMPTKMRLRLPQDTKYESEWWIRKVSRDGRYYGKFEFEAEEALKAATVYAEKTSIGNLSLLRQFLEMSMRRSTRPYKYLEAFIQILNPKGVQAYAEKVVKVLKVPLSIVYRVAKNNLDIAVKLMLGFTRKRDLLVPEWADDQKLWVAPPSNLLVSGM